MLDILPTTHVYESVDQRLATAYYHWFFFLQPEPVPERLIAGDPVWYLHTLLGAWGGGLDVYDPAALAGYERLLRRPGRRHAMLQDYRAAAAVDSRWTGPTRPRAGWSRLRCWCSGARASVVGTGPDDVLDGLADPGHRRRGPAVDAAHFLAEERPAETLAALEEFLD